MLSIPQNYLEAIFPNPLSQHLPFDIPNHSVLSNVGSTPIAEIDPGVWAKLEGFNFSGSIKDRAVLCMVLKMIEEGTLVNGSTLVLVTSGSAGLSLALIQRALAADCGFDLRTMIIMPKAYSKKAVAQKMVGEHAVPTFYDKPDPDAACQLLLLDGVFMEVMQQGKDIASRNGYAVLDQHYDMNSMLAHKSTAAEVLLQMPDVTDVVCATGTGATAAGLRNFLPSHIAVHSRPSESGKIDGLSDVNRYDNFCDTRTLEGYSTSSFFDVDHALEHQQLLRDEHSLEVGMSTGATMWLARQIKEQKQDSKVMFISACGRPL
jgi:cysteine synthase A